MQGPEAMVEKLESFIRENLTDDADEIINWLEVLKTYKPDEYRSKVREFAKKLRILNKVKDKNPEKYAAYIKAIKLEVKCSKLGKKYGEAKTEKDKEKIRNELKEALGELFEIKQAENEDRIKQIEKKLSELKEKNSLRKEHREEIVNRRLEQLTASASGLAW